MPLTTTGLPALLLALVAQATSSPFDPSGYIETKATQEVERAATLATKGIYKIDGRRYHKFSTGGAAVFLPGAGDVPDMLEGSAVCEQHLQYRREVLKIRDGLPIDDVTRRLEPELVAMVWKCQEDRVRGPAVEVLTPNGAVVQMAPKVKAPKVNKVDSGTSPAGGGT